MRLYMDKNLVIQEFKKRIYEEINESRPKLVEEIRRRIDSGDSHFKVGQDVQTSIETVENRIKLYIEGNALVLFNNYGSGSLMDVNDNALIGEYIGFESGSNWNRHRSVSDTTIRGRDAGTYIDIFGKERTSTGSLAGKPLEGKKIYSSVGGGAITIEPTHPTKAIEIAIEWYMAEFDDIFFRAIDKMDFSSCFSYK